MFQLSKPWDYAGNQACILRKQSLGCEEKLGKKNPRRLQNDNVNEESKCYVFYLYLVIKIGLKGFNGAYI